MTATRASCPADRGEQGRGTFLPVDGKSGAARLKREKTGGGHALPTVVTPSEHRGRAGEVLMSPKEQGRNGKLAAGSGNAAPLARY